MSAYIDVHCHLTDPAYDDFDGVEAVVRRAEDAGVTRMICSGCSLSSSIVAKEIAEKYESVYFCVGVHPCELDKYREGDLDELAVLCHHEKCVAVGEIGLDYHYDNNPPKALQRELFIRQLELADEVGLPVVLHSRDSAQDTLEILEANAHLLRKGGVMHCYSYSAEMSERFARLGLHFSFGGTSTFKNARKVLDSVRRIPAPLLLSETDCPYLTPEPFRGVFPNEPCRVVHVVEKLAQLKETTSERMQRQILENAKKLFFKLP